MRSIWRRSIAAAAAAAVVAGLMGAGSAYADHDDHEDGHANGRSYTVGLFGDVPYGAAGRIEYPRLLADMNDANLAFSIFDGDLKAGGDGACTDALYTQSLRLVQQLRPPGGRHARRQRLDGLLGPLRPGHRRLRRRLSDSTTSGRSSIRPTRASGAHDDGAAGERRSPATRRTGRTCAGRRPVMFIGLNVQGSNDNLPHAGVDGENRPASEIARMAAEHQAREAANIHWLSESYARGQAARRSRA